jgi:cell volume regulation protein A
VDSGELNTILLVGAGVLLAAILAVRVSLRAGLPSLLVYLGMGVALGESGIGIRFDDASLAQALGFAALVVIVAEGGLTSRWSQIRPVLPVSVLLATVGVVISVAVVAVVVHFLLGLGWQQSALIGAVTSSTDAAAIFSVLRRVPVRDSVRGLLEAESGLNDAIAVLLVVLLSTAGWAQQSIPGAVALVLYELAAGVVAGFAVGAAGVWLLRRVALPASGLYPLALLSLNVLAYASSAVLHWSGFAAVYVSALILGNAELPHRNATRSFVEGLAWLAQIGMFVMLGLLASPGRLEWWHAGWALVAGLSLTFVARPLSVLACALPFRMPWRHQAFVSWAGLRGAVPIVLATIPLTARVEGARDVFDIVFLLVVVFTLIQAPALPAAAIRLGVTDDAHARDLEVEAAPLERLRADLLQIGVTPASRLHGMEVDELRLPRGVSVSLVVREPGSFVPDGRTVLRRGDEVLVVTPRRLRELTERRLRAVSRGGRLAGWFDDDDERV